MIIFDASGSMWGQIEGEPKISIAKDALKRVIGSLNPDIELGLMVYGHRSKGDCSDIERMIPIGKVDKRKMIARVMEISPKGKTPISRSIKKAADALRYTEEKATIILISDGKETCDPDPCATAKQLKKEGIDLVAHVIGFNVDKNTDRQLACIANATGGEYFSAKSADSLNEAIRSVVKKVEVPKPVVKKPEYSLKLSASETEGGELVEADHFIYMYEQEADHMAGEQVNDCSSSKEKKCKLKLLPGKYVVETRYNEYAKYTPIEIVQGKSIDKNIIMGATGKLKLSASETEGGKPVEADHFIHQYDEEAENYMGGAQITNCSSDEAQKCKRKLPVGKYRVETTYDQLKKYTTVEVVAHKTIDKNIVMGETGTEE